MRQWTVTVNPHCHKAAAMLMSFDVKASQIAKYHAQTYTSPDTIANLRLGLFDEATAPSDTVVVTGTVIGNNMRATSADSDAAKCTAARELSVMCSSLTSRTFCHDGGSPEITVAREKALSHMMLTDASYIPVCSSECLATASSHGALYEVMLPAPAVGPDDGTSKAG